MTERVPVPAAIAIVAPLLAASLAMPPGLDSAVHPLVAGGIPLAWAMVVFTVVRGDGRGLGAALLCAMPFSSLSLAAYGSRPILPYLAVLAMTSAASTACLETTARPRGYGRPAAITLMLAGAAPGISVALLAGPWSGVSVSALVAVVSLYVRYRRLR
jgi:hypothetical protein